MALTRAVFFLSLFCAPLAADTVIYSTGFESPTYSTGQLIGQDGWVLNTGSATAAFIENTLVDSGAQALEFLGSGGSTQPIHFSSSDTSDQILDTALAFFVQPGTGQLRLSLAALGTYSIFAEADLNASTGVLSLSANNLSGSPVTLPTGTWNTIDLQVRPIENQVSLYLNGALVQSGTPTSPTTGLGAEAFFNVGGTANYFVDNFSVTSTLLPEPATLTSVFAGAIALAALARKRARLS